MSPRPQTATMDPQRQAREIVFTLASYDFPWDVEKALEFALFRTYAVPGISSLLARTGEFETRTRKRYDDTELILSEIVENGPDHPRGAEALARMNEMHGRYRIPNDQYLYVLSTFVFEPIRWIARFGWRDLSEGEKAAIFAYYRDLGQRMGITDIPEDMASFEAFNRDYEARHFAPAESNRRIGDVTLDLMLGFYLPRGLFRLGRPAALALMDAPLRAAMGYEAPPRWLERAVPAGLRLRAALLRVLPKRRRAKLITARKRPTYPGGYAIRDLGTFRDR
ncbi:hypothetical protein SAMN06297129_3193 [Pseudooceanicola antarcticus]|uniref:DUF2236 domain-containing protein n=1 Tax=Pseudooceanicola antarcticus TaxID=1247613 RepID=A0A285J708_9RHOB|nr:oxygenase MpaB family protein [Pseudooceanicola antarcticus]PJE27004.1 DUF2236 domain-containing protein [Pseudooceanicola antarcticus]SNY56105.1 hypothetical protein SAMN06297129_3193 [Pseudooceanicola antarcticus]